MELFFEYGYAAYEAGMKRVPTLDRLLYQELEGMAVGTGAADKMQAWLNGWDAAQKVHSERSEELRYSPYRDEIRP